MALMKNLMVTECNGVEASEPYQSHNQRQMNHHSAKAMEMSRMSRNHAIHAEHTGEASMEKGGHVRAAMDDAMGQHKELARAYGAAAKAHLSLADHHAAQFKKERTDTVKDMTTTPKKIKALK